jgi:hypothetical protein
MFQGLKASANTYTVAYKFVDQFGNVLVFYLELHGYVLVSLK